MTATLVWFRHDLRVADHPALVAAAESGEVVALYCFDPRDFETTSFGFPKTGSHRAQFLIESVTQLRDALRAIGGELIVRCGRPETVIAEMLDQFPITAVHYHREVGTEERSVERSVDSVCRDNQVDIHCHWSHTLLHPDDLPFSVSQTPDVFSRFRRRVEKRWDVREPLASPKLPSMSIAIPCGDVPTIDQLGVASATSDSRAMRAYHGGESAGLDRLRTYLWEADRLRVYKETRNGMLNPDDSSKFSPWLAHGCLSPRTIYAEVKRYEMERVENDSTYWLIFELLWRDYFRFIARKHVASIFRVEGLRGVALPWKTDPPRFSAWQEGQTGFPMIDANMRELAATGYMSNRGRQNVASFLTKNLGIDWRMGAEWFESCLIDYDVASNWGNWNYSAGVGNDPRGFRFFNVIKQSEQYDPDGDYVRHWCPELKHVNAKMIHAPWKLSRQQQRDAG
ncbi:MAG: DASH family cryptochrome, partial [Planctomycetota bacterium]